MDIVNTYTLPQELRTYIYIYIGTQCTHTKWGHGSKNTKLLKNGPTGEKTRGTFERCTHTHTYNILYVMLYTVYKNDVVHEIQGENSKPTPITTLVFALVV